MATAKEFEDLKKKVESREREIDRLVRDYKSIRSSVINIVDYLQSRTRSKKNKKILDLAQDKLWF